MIGFPIVGDWATFSTRIGLALLAGLLIGFEREWHRKPAGLRTHALVSVGACVYVVLGLILVGEEGGDPSRIIGQVVTGVGFLGAGVSFRQGANIQGLTTAATIWCSAAVGCLLATGLYVEAALASVAILLVNSLLKAIEDRLVKSDHQPKG